METLIIYALKVSIAMAVFYLLHLLAQKNETFFRLRRAFFLFALSFSLLFPLMSLNWLGLEGVQGDFPTISLAEIVILADGTAAAEGTAVTSFDWQKNVWSLLLLLGIAGTVFMLGRFVIQLTSLAKLLRKSKMVKSSDGMRITRIEDSLASSFSFFKWIVINVQGKNEKQLSDILLHETTHARQLHSVDVLLYEAFCIFFWWNPFAWLMKNEMKLNLEYLADKEVLGDKVDYKDYQYTLLQISIANTGVAFINNFNVSHVKKRIIMMNKKRSPLLAVAKYVLILPALLLLMYCNSKEEKAADTPAETTNVVPPQSVADLPSDVPVAVLEEPLGEVFEIVEEMPKFPGGEAALMKFIGENLKYPEKAQEEGIQGRVTIRYIVDAKGAIRDAKILRGIDPGCDAEALRVIEAMPKWEPGKQNGKAVPVYFTIPILFRLK